MYNLKAPTLFRCVAIADCVPTCMAFVWPHTISCPPETVKNTEGRRGGGRENDPRERERERETERQRDRERDSDRDRETETETETERQRQGQRQRKRERHSE